MKEKYIKASMQICSDEETDIIQASGGDDSNGGNMLEKDYFEDYLGQP